MLNINFMNVKPLINVKCTLAPYLQLYWLRTSSGTTSYLYHQFRNTENASAHQHHLHCTCTRIASHLQRLHTFIGIGTCTKTTLAMHWHCASTTYVLALATHRHHTCTRNKLMILLQMLLLVRISHCC